MAPSAKSRSTSTDLKQATLGFISSKRTSSLGIGKAKTKPIRTQSTPVTRTKAIVDVENSSQEGGKDDVQLTSSDKVAQKQGLRVVEKTKTGIESADLNSDDPRWRKHHAAIRKKLGDSQPIHSQGQNIVHEILRTFDLSYEYGPCVGVTRLERWERAAALGLNPPSEVRDILSTSQGVNETGLSQSVFYDEV